MHIHMSLSLKCKLIEPVVNLQEGPLSSDMRVNRRRKYSFSRTDPHEAYNHFLLVNVSQNII